MKPTGKNSGTLTLSKIVEEFGSSPDVFVMSQTQKRLYEDLIKPFNEKMEAIDANRTAPHEVKKPKPNSKEYPAYIMEKVMGREARMYCVRCRGVKIVTDAEKVFMKNGKPALKAKCPKCGTGMYKIGSA